MLAPVASAATADRGPIAFTLFDAIRTVPDGRNVGDPSALPLIARGAEPAWSPDGTRLAYLSGPAQGPFTALVVADADGTGAREVVRVEPGGRVVTLSAAGDAVEVVADLVKDGTPGRPNRLHGMGWAPSGRALRLSLEIGGGTFFHRIDVVTGASRELGAVRNPRLRQAADIGWSPNGRLVAFSVPVTRFTDRGCRGGEGRVYTYRLGAERPVRVAPRRGLCAGPAFDDRGPAFSPDGTRLLITRGRAIGPGAFRSGAHPHAGDHARGSAGRCRARALAGAAQRRVHNDTDLEWTYEWSDHSSGGFLHPPQDIPPRSALVFSSQSKSGSVGTGAIGVCRFQAGGPGDPVPGRVVQPLGR